MKNKKAFIIFGILGSVLLLGVTYAFFNYYKESRNANVVAGDIYFNLNDEMQGFSLNNVFPETIEEARSKGDANTLTFSITGKNQSDRDIYYEILLNEGEEKEGKTRFNPEHLVFDLVQIDGDTRTYLLQAVSYDVLDNTRIWTDTVSSGTNSSINRQYELRMWLSDKVTFGEGPGIDYTSEVFANSYASIKVAVRGDFIEKKVDNLYQAVKMDTNSLKYTGAHQDSLTGYGNQDIYYFTSDATSNVVFNNTCWQIIRTTDTGGVKMIYNGEAEEKEVYETNTKMTDNDITIVSNTSGYEYTYDSIEKNWTSSTQTNNVDRIIEFKVNTPGYYTINYTLSTRESNDWVYIYIDNFLIRQDSGVKDGFIRLGNLTEDNVIKINYSKKGTLANGDNNIIFEIVKGSGSKTLVTTCDKGRQAGIGLIGSNSTANLGNLEYANYEYGSSYTYDENGFQLVDTITATWSDDTYESLIGKYVCDRTTLINNDKTKCTKVYYIQNYQNSLNANSAYYEIGSLGFYSTIGRSPFNANNGSLSSVGYMFNAGYNQKVEFAINNTTIKNYGYVSYSSNITKNGEKYEMNSPITINASTEWNANYSVIKNKYLCVGGVDENNLCSKENLRFVTYTDTTDYSYYNAGITWRFGNDVTYSNGHYTLSGTTQDVTDWYNSYTANRDFLTNTHYTCLNENESSECGNYVYFVFSANKTEFYYIKLENGKTKEDALYEMINYKGNDNGKADANINKYDSAVKQVVDHWYEHTFLTSKTNMLEDIIYCNDRTINNLRGFDNNKTGNLTFSAVIKLICENNTDKFTVSNDKAKLKYPVGLLIAKERELMGNDYAKSGYSSAINNPAQYAGYDGTFVWRVIANGTLYDGRVNASSGIRPVISLANTTKIISGNGTYDAPYIME